MPACAPIVSFALRVCRCHRVHQFHYPCTGPCAPIPFPDPHARGSRVHQELTMPVCTHHQIIAPTQPCAPFGHQEGSMCTHPFRPRKDPVHRGCHQEGTHPCAPFTISHAVLCTSSFLRECTHLFLHHRHLKKGHREMKWCTSFLPSPEHLAVSGTIPPISRGRGPRTLPGASPGAREMAGAQYSSTMCPEHPLGRVAHQPLRIPAKGSAHRENGSPTKISVHPNLLPPTTFPPRCRPGHRFHQAATTPILHAPFCTGTLCTEITQSMHRSSFSPNHRTKTTRSFSFSILYN